MAVRNVNTWNDVNRASASTVKQSPAFGRGRGHKAAQVVNKRNPCELFTCTEKLFIGTWNIRTLFAAGSLDILLHQLHDYRWSIVGLAETRWTGAGEFTKDDYRIIYSGRKDDKHQEGVAFVLRKEASNALLGYKCLGSRIITARFRTSIGKPQ